MQPESTVVLVELERLGVTKQATSIKHGDQTVVSSNSDILKVTVVKVHVLDLKVLNVLVVTVVVIMVNMININMPCPNISPNRKFIFVSRTILHRGKTF